VLTGESVPVAKVTAALAKRDGDSEDTDVAVGDRINMAFRQTSVTQGSGKGESYEAQLRIRGQNSPCASLTNCLHVPHHVHCICAS
jgi:hypothetical protein